MYLYRHYHSSTGAPTQYESQLYMLIMAFFNRFEVESRLEVVLRPTDLFVDCSCGISFVELITFDSLFSNLVHTYLDSTVEL